MSDISQTYKANNRSFTLFNRLISRAFSPTNLILLFIVSVACTWWMTFKIVEKHQTDVVSEKHMLLAESAARHVDAAFLKVIMSLTAAMHQTDRDRVLTQLSPLGIVGVCFEDGTGTDGWNACSRTNSNIWVHSTNVSGTSVEISEIFLKESYPVVLVKTSIENQSLIGVLSMSSFQAIQSKIQFGEKGHATIFSAAGRIVAHPNREWERQARDLSSVSIVDKTLQKSSGVARFFSPATQSEMIAGHAYASTPGWGVIVPQPYAELARTARNVANRSVLPVTLGILALSVLFVSTLRSRRELFWMIDTALSEIDKSDALTRLSGSQSYSKATALEGLATRISKIADQLRHGRQVEEDWRSQMQVNLEIARDLAKSEKKRRELVEASNAKERQDALGELVASVAHDVNNDLSVVRAHAEAIIQDPAAKSTRTELSLKEILRATEKGKSLTRQLLSSSGRSNLYPILVDPKVSLVDAQSAARSVVPQTVGFSFTASEEFHWIFVDPNQLQVALLNLVLNASEAIGTKGCIRFSTSVIKIDPSTSDPYQKNKPPVCIRLTISDDGRGMSDEQLKRAKEPFFSSKKFGAGSGLGLAMVASFAQRSGGCLRLESELGVGTKAHLTFPAQEIGDQKQAASAIAVKGEKPQKARTIMLVEDEPALRPILKAVMEKKGCTVEAYECGEDAVERIQAGFVPDVLITDMVMPGKIQGDELIACVRQKLEDLPVVVMSGYSDSINRDNVNFGGRLTFMQKPVSATEILKEAELLLEQS